MWKTMSNEKGGYMKKKLLAMLCGVIIFSAFTPLSLAQYQGDHFRQQQEIQRRMEEDRRHRELIEAQRQQNRQLEEIRRQMQQQQQEMQRRRAIPQNRQVPSLR